MAILPQTFNPGSVGGGNLAAGQVDTHCAIVTGAGSTAAGDTTIGTITLPADGPWKIFGAFCQIARPTATAGESLGGHFRLEGLDGDIQPNPAPSRFPTGLGGSFLGATDGIQIQPLQIWDCEYEAPGKARIGMIYNEASAVTVATQVVMGLIFGKQRPERRPF